MKSMVSDIKKNLIGSYEQQNKSSWERSKRTKKSHGEYLQKTAEDEKDLKRHEQ